MSTSLNQIPADRKLIEALYSKGVITVDSRDHALNTLFPANQWGVWISRILLAIGSALVLSGVVFFFAFNWNKISPLLKFTVIESSIVLCLLGAFFVSLQKLVGQVLLLSGSVLTGVFLAVFGQIYQTGANAYQLFMMWSLLIFAWTVVSNFSAQWILWLAISNTFIIFWWQQAVLPERDMYFFLFALLTLFNGMALFLREYLLGKANMEWLLPSWVRAVLALAILVVMAIPIVLTIIQPARATISIIISAGVGVVGHIILFGLYRFKLKDLPTLAITTLSICVIAEVFIVKVFIEIFNDASFALFFMMAITTLGVFTGAVYYLRGVKEYMEVKDE